jgi:uncharacterized membrane protein
MNKTTLIVGGVAAVGLIAILLSSKGAQASTKGRMVINTAPAGASIHVNGSNWGTSPLDVEVDPGTYTVLIQLEGYNDISTSVTTEAGVAHTLNVSLTTVGSEWQPIDIAWS